MKFAEWLGEFFGRVLRHVVPVILEEWRKPVRTEFVGGGTETEKALAASIVKAMSGGYSVDDFRGVNGRLRGDLASEDREATERANVSDGDELVG